MENTALFTSKYLRRFRIKLTPKTTTLNDKKLTNSRTKLGGYIQPFEGNKFYVFSQNQSQKCISTLNPKANNHRKNYIKYNFK